MRLSHSAAVWLIAGSAFTCSWALDVVVVAATPLFAVLAYSCFLFLFLGQGLSAKAWRFSLADIFTLLFLFWIFLSCIWSLDSETSFRLSYYYLLSFLLFYLVEHLAVDRVAWRRIGLSFVMGAVVAGLMLMLRAVVFGVSMDERETVGGINANYIAYSLATAIPIFFAYSKTGGGGGLRVFLR